jgi:hypothetical protein
MSSSSQTNIYTQNINKVLEEKHIKDLKEIIIRNSDIQKRIEYYDTHTLISWISKNKHKLDYKEVLKHHYAKNFFEEEEEIIKTLYDNNRELLLGNPYDQSINLYLQLNNLKSNKDLNRFINELNKMKNDVRMEFNTNPCNRAVTLIKKIIANNTTYIENNFDHFAQNTDDEIIIISYNYYKKNQHNQYILYKFWEKISENPSNIALKILDENQDKINWITLSNNTNPNIFNLIKKYYNFYNIEYFNNSYKKKPNIINWIILLKFASSLIIDYYKENENVILSQYTLFKKRSQIFYQNNIYTSLSSNPNAIHLLANEVLEQNQDKIDWKELSSNPNAIELLKNNQDKINFRELYKNTNRDILKLFIKYDKNEINLEYFLTNVSALPFIKKYYEKNGLTDDEWKILSKNPKIFRKKSKKESKDKTSSIL